jgi:hypothetical protein
MSAAENEPTSEEKKLTPEEKEALSKVYEKLRGLLEEYAEETARGQHSTKSVVFGPLKEAILTASNWSPAHREQSSDPLVRIQEFEKELDKFLSSGKQGRFDYEETIKRHNNRTIKIKEEKLDAYSVASIATVIPAIIRALYSYNKYGTGKFWKPKSQKIIECAQRELKELHDKKILPSKN